MEVRTVQRQIAQVSAVIEGPSLDRSKTGWSRHAAFCPDLLPPLELMWHEQVEILEDWFCWAHEWHTFLRIYGAIKSSSRVLEIGCGLGRIAYVLKEFLQLGGGTYDGFDICEFKIDFLKNIFAPQFPHCRFLHADVHNSTYNPGGTIAASKYTFPYEDGSFDVIYAASVFTHMLPDNAERYLRESARLLIPGGRCVFSFFLLDYYVPGQLRPLSFNQQYFSLDHQLDRYGSDFATAQIENPEDMTGFTSTWVERKGREAGLKLIPPILPGLWSGSHESWIGQHDLIIFEKE